MKVTKYLLGLRACKEIIPLIFVSFFFVACDGGQFGYHLADAEAAGIIMPQAYFDADESGSQIVRVELQDITTNTTFMAPITFPRQQDLYFDALYGDITIYVEEGQRVQAGDVLAHLSFDIDTRLELDYFSAVQRLEQFDAEFAREQNRRRAEIAAAQYGSPQRRLLDTQLEHFVFVSGIARDTLLDEAADLAYLLLGENIIAPFDGIVTYIVGPPYNLRWNPLIATIVDDSTFFFQITMGDAQPLIDRYNNIGHGDIVTLRTTARHVVGGVEQPMLEFDARVVTDSWASGMRGLFTYLLVPVDMNSFQEAVMLIESENGSRGMHNLPDLVIMAHVEIIHARDALTLPTDAVRFADPRNYVFVYNEGGLGRRYIQAGVRGGGLVQIISGLEAGTEVVIVP